MGSSVDLCRWDRSSGPGWLQLDAGDTSGRGLQGLLLVSGISSLLKCKVCAEASPLWYFPGILKLWQRGKWQRAVVCSVGLGRFYPKICVVEGGLGQDSSRNLRALQ